MRPCRLHDWDLSIAEAREVQSRLAHRVEPRNGLRGRPRLIAGLDISGAFGDGEALAAAVVLRYPGLEIVEIQTARVRPPFPYVLVLLSFREIPVLFAALERLTVQPDLLVVDGHGLAHPRRFGLASHLDVLFDIPAIGCANSLLAGSHGRLREARGSPPRWSTRARPSARRSGDPERREAGQCVRRAQGRHKERGAVGPGFRHQVPIARADSARSSGGLGRPG